MDRYTRFFYWTDHGWVFGYDEISDIGSKLDQSTDKGGTNLYFPLPTTYTHINAEWLRTVLFLLYHLFERELCHVLLPSLLLPSLPFSVTSSLLDGGVDGNACASGMYGRVGR